MYVYKYKSYLSLAHLSLFTFKKNSIDVNNRIKLVNVPYDYWKHIIFINIYKELDIVRI